MARSLRHAVAGRAKGTCGIQELISEVEKGLGMVREDAEVAVRGLLIWSNKSQHLFCFSSNSK